MFQIVIHGPDNDKLYAVTDDEHRECVASISERPEVSSESKSRVVPAGRGIVSAASQVLLVGDSPEPSLLPAAARVDVDVLRSGLLSRDGLRTLSAAYDESIHDVSADDPGERVALISDSPKANSVEQIGNAFAEGGGSSVVSQRLPAVNSLGFAPRAASALDVVELSDSSMSDESIGEIAVSLDRRYIPCPPRERLPLGRWDVFELDPAAWGML